MPCTWEVSWRGCQAWAGGLGLTLTLMPPAVWLWMGHDLPRVSCPHSQVKYKDCRRLAVARTGTWSVRSSLFWYPYGSLVPGMSFPLLLGQAPLDHFPRKAPLPAGQPPSSSLALSLIRLLSAPSSHGCHVSQLRQIITYVAFYVGSSA